MSRPRRVTQSKDAQETGPASIECIALLLQGGGAPGACQAGVYQAVSEAHLDPDWVAGISIGAINSALISGNRAATRLEKLRAF
jgi:NTE family protein